MVVRRRCAGMERDRSRRGRSGLPGDVPGGPEPNGARAVPALALGWFEEGSARTANDRMTHPDDRPPRPGPDAAGRPGEGGEHLGGERAG